MGKSTSGRCEELGAVSAQRTLNVIVDGMAKKVLIASVVEQEFISSKFPFEKM